MSESSFVLVTGATGQQGGATARALLRAGTEVRALVRDPASDRARELAAAGATLVEGDLEDRSSLVAALAGARGVFSVQMPDLDDPLGDLEVRLAGNLAAAAAQAGVEQIVHTSALPRLLGGTDMLTLRSDLPRAWMWPRIHSER